MATISRKSLSKIEHLYYDEHLSAQEIALKLDVSMDAVYYFMRHNKIKRRDKNEANRLRFQKALPSFKLRNISNAYLEKLRIIGTMLYWGEGSKWDGEVIVDFANSDKDMILLFLKFLREVCGVDEKKLRVFPYFYANQDADENIRYWSGITKIKKEQFTKPYIKKDSRKEKINKMKHGLVHVRYADKKLLMLIRNWIEEYKKY